MSDPDADNSRMSRSRLIGSVVLTAALLVPAIILWIKCQKVPAWTAAVLALIVALFIIVFAIYENRKLWFGFAFGVMLASLAAATMPFVFLDPAKMELRPNRAMNLLVGCVEKCDGAVDDRCLNKPQWVLTIGSIASRDDAKGNTAGLRVHTIKGGLAVPLYVLVLALLGGAVSLTRRVPEYQKRAAEGYTPTEKEPALDGPTLREYLVFQIVQFISAPLIAVAAFFVLEPEKTGTAAAVGFVSGFSSETILLWIRAAVTKVKPDTGKKTPTGTVCGKVTDEKGAAVPNAKVTLLGVKGVATDTDTGGFYTLNGVPQGSHVLEVADDDQRKSLETVTVEAGRATRHEVTLKDPGSS